MKKSAKLLVLLTLFALMASMLSGCLISEEDAVGTWTGVYEYDGNDFAVAFVLSSDGRYEKATMKNGSISSMESGDWEISGFKVCLYDDAATTHHGICTEYTVKGDALVNNDHYFYKAS